MIPSARPKTAELVHQLAAMSLAPQVDQLALARVKAQANALIKVPEHAASAYMVLAIALEIEGRIGEAIDTYHKALRLEPLNYDIRSNYSISLERVGRLEESLAIRRELFEQAPDDINRFLAYAEAAAEACRFDLCPQLEAIAKKLKIEDRYYQYHREDWADAAERLEEVGGSFLDLCGLASAVRYQIRTSGTRIVGAETLGDFDDHVVRRFYTPGSVEDASDLSFAIADMVVASKYAFLIPIMTFACASIESERYAATAA